MPGDKHPSLDFGSPERPKLRDRHDIPVESDLKEQSIPEQAAVLLFELQNSISILVREVWVITRPKNNLPVAYSNPTTQLSCG
jgi:hypothetical protein